MKRHTTKYNSILLSGLLLITPQLLLATPTLVSHNDVDPVFSIVKSSGSGGSISGLQVTCHASCDTDNFLPITSTFRGDFKAAWDAQARVKWYGTNRPSLVQKSWTKPITYNWTASASIGWSEPQDGVTDSDATGMMAEGKVVTSGDYLTASMTRTITGTSTETAPYGRSTPGSASINTNLTLIYELAPTGPQSAADNVGGGYYEQNYETLGSGSLIGLALDCDAFPLSSPWCSWESASSATFLATLSGATIKTWAIIS